MLRFKQYIAEQRMLLEISVNGAQQHFGHIDKEHVRTYAGYFTPNKKQTKNPNADERGHKHLKALLNWHNSETKKNPDFKPDEAYKKRTQNAINNFVPTKDKNKGPMNFANVGEMEKHNEEHALPPVAEGHTRVHEDKKTGVAIDRIDTKEGAKKHCKDTQWCTSRDDDHNAFDSYTQGRDGKPRAKEDMNLHVIHHGGKKWQADATDKTIMDKNDQSVEHEDSDFKHEDDDRILHPDVSKAMAKTPSLAHNNLLSNNPHFKVTSKHIDDAMKHPNSNIAILLLRHHHEHITQEHIDAAMKHRHGAVAAAALDYCKDKIKPRHIDAAMMHPNSNVALTAMEEHKDKITTKHIDAAMKHRDSGVAEVALREHKDKITQEHIDAAMKHPNGRVVAAAMEEHKDKITQEHIDAAMKHRHGAVVAAAMEENEKRKKREEDRKNGATPKQEKKTGDKD